MNAPVPPSPPALLELGRGYVLDTLTHKLTREGRVMQLSPLASRLLQVLAQRPGEVVERGEIIEALWKGDWLVGDPALSRLVSELRRDTGDDAKQPTLVQTVPRRGYRLVSQLAAAEPAPVATVGKEPWWPQAWRLANRSLLIMIGGTALIMVLAILVRWAR